MRIAIIAVGRLKERYWVEAATEYLKRLKPYAEHVVHEVADRDPGRGGEARALADEAVDILKAVPDGSYLIALDIAGTPVSSVELAQRLERLGIEGRSSLAFAVGGSHGLDASVLDRADLRLSLGRITLPHNLARIVLLEQLYRAFRIIRNEPYHK